MTPRGNRSGHPHRGVVDEVERPRRGGTHAAAEYGADGLIAARTRATHSDAWRINPTRFGMTLTARDQRQRPATAQARNRRSSRARRIDTRSQATGEPERPDRSVQPSMRIRRWSGPEPFAPRSRGGLRIPLASVGADEQYLVADSLTARRTPPRQVRPSTTWVTSW
jgi:hypothetical protein